MYRLEGGKRPFAIGLVCVFILLGSLGANQRKRRPTYTDPAKAGADFALQGEYVGTLTEADGKQVRFGVQVVARGDGRFDAVGYRGGLPGAGGDPKSRIKASDTKPDGAGVFPDLLGGAVIEKNTLKISNADGKTAGVLKRVHRKSPTLGAKPPKGATVLFGDNVNDFKPGTTTTDKLLDVFLRRNHQTSDYRFKRDFQLHLEFRTPYMPFHRGQDRGNSGVHLPGIREIQVLDTFGEEGKKDECGAFYGWKPPAVNMCFPPLSWQTYDVDVKVATFDDRGNSASPTVVTVRHNGIVIHDQVEQTRRRKVDGPLRLQYHDNPVHYRNIWVVEKRR